MENKKNSGSGFNPTLPRVSEPIYNQMSQMYFEDAICWTDANHNRAPEPAEFATCPGFVENRDAFIQKGLQGESFTSAFNERYQKIFELAESRRRDLVRRELEKVEKKVIRTELGKLGLSKDEVAMSLHLVTAGRLVGLLHRQQQGLLDEHERVMADGTPEEIELDRHNQGPSCVTMNDPLCNALPDTPQMSFYPPSMTDEAREAPDNVRCDLLERHKESNPFSVPVERNGKLTFIPYAEAYRGLSEQVSGELTKAAAIARKIKDVALAEYLEEAAKAMLAGGPNPYFKADLKWAAMAGKSKFFVRVGADEVDWDPCNQHAGFHLIFGIVDPAAAKDAEKFAPHVQAMETEFARMAGSSYKARKVQIHLPEFVNVIIMEGDARSAIGSSIGQTLPNWFGEDGMAAGGPSRTMQYLNHIALSSYANDRPDMAEIISPRALAFYKADPRIVAETVVLHEYTHNFGPTFGYTLPGTATTMKNIFGSDILAMEELKAETGSRYFAEYLKNRGLFSQEQVNQFNLSYILWNFGHLRKGLRFKDDLRAAGSSPYTKLSAIQIGWLVDQGAIAFDDETQQWDIRFDRLPKAYEQLFRKLANIYSTGDAAGLAKLLETYASGEGLRKLRLDVLERVSEKLKERAFRYEVLP